MSLLWHIRYFIILCFIPQINAAVQQCLDYFEFCKAAVNKNSKVTDFSQQHCGEYLCMPHIICTYIHILWVFEHATSRGRHSIYSISSTNVIWLSLKRKLIAVVHYLGCLYIQNDLLVLQEVPRFCKVNYKGKILFFLLCFALLLQMICRIFLTLDQNCSTSILFIHCAS